VFNALTATDTMWIRLKNIYVFAFHGAYEHEKKYGSRFEIDVEISADLTQASDTDQLESTIDYVEVYGLVQHISKTESFVIIEAWIHRLASEILKQFSLADEVIVRIRKPAAPVGGSLDAVELEHHLKRDIAGVV
jgi:dihydroneopterin aldolase